MLSQVAEKSKECVFAATSPSLPYATKYLRLEHMHTNSTSPVIDIHVHVASIDPATGCHVSPRLYNSFIFRFLRWQQGIRPTDTPAEADAKFQKRFQREIDGAPSVKKCVILALDAVYDSSGRQDLENSTFYIPNDYIFRLCREDNRLLPGVSINPLRPDAIDELERCRELGALLVKWLPNTQGFDPGDSRFRPFRRKLAEVGMPLLSHTGNEYSLKSMDQTMGDPARLRPVLDDGVTVIAAHGGGEGYLAGGYLRPFIKMLLDYPNLHADTSALCLPIRLPCLFGLLKHPEVHHKLIHGSDAPLPIDARVFIGRLSLAQIRELNRISSSIERDYRIKQALGFPEAVFTRGAELLFNRPY